MNTPIDDTDHIGLLTQEIAILRNEAAAAEREVSELKRHLGAIIKAAEALRDWCDNQEEQDIASEQMIAVGLAVWAYRAAFPQPASEVLA